VAVYNRMDSEMFLCFHHLMLVVATDNEQCIYAFHSLCSKITHLSHYMWKKIKLHITYQVTPVSHYAFDCV